MPNPLSDSKTPISSSRRKSVFLREWWLIKVEKESKLGVGGFVNRETLSTRGMRILGSPSTGKRPNINAIEDGIQVYCSAAIAKRHDSNTLEAVDGIIIRISGCINKSRTLSYGLSPEVCNGFLSGFPCTWEDYASKSSHDKCAKQSLPVSFDDLPVTRVRDLLMSESESHALTSIILGDILKHTEKTLDQSVSPNKAFKKSTETEVDHNQDDDDILKHTEKTLDQSVSPNKAFKKSTEAEVDHNQDDDDDDDVSLSNPTQKIIEEDYKITMDSHLESSKETEDDAFLLDEIHNITEEKWLKQSPRRCPLRSARKRTT